MWPLCFPYSDFYMWCIHLHDTIGMKVWSATSENPLIKASKPFTYIVEIFIATFRFCTKQLMIVGPEVVGLKGWIHSSEQSVDILCVFPAVCRCHLYKCCKQNFSHSNVAVASLETWRLKSACLSLSSRAQAVTGLFERDLCSIHPHCSHQYHRLVSHTLSAIVGFSTCPVQTLCPSPLPPFLPLSIALSASLSLSLSLSHALSLSLMLSLRENSSQLSEGERASVTEVES